MGHPLILGNISIALPGYIKDDKLTIYILLQLYIGDLFILGSIWIAPTACMRPLASSSVLHTAVSIIKVFM